MALAAGLVVLLVAAVLVWVFLSGDVTGDVSGDDVTTSSSGPTGTSTPSSNATSPTITTGTAAPPPTKPIRASFGDEVDLGNGVQVDIVDIEAVEGEAERPSEVGGPSLRFTVRVDNRSGDAIDLDLAVVNAYFGSDQRPATRLQEPGGVALPQVLPDGRTATGKYIFNVPVDERDQVTLEFTFTVESPVVIYTGAARGS